MTAVEFLAERYNYITWLRNRDEISAGTADEWRAKFLKEAKEMEEKEMTQEELVEWLKEYRLNLMSLMGQDDYVTGKLDVIKDVLDKCNTK